MSKLRNYCPKIKISLEDKILETTRRMVTSLSNFDAKGSIKHNGNTNEVQEAIHGHLVDFQHYIGTTCGDHASHWFDDGHWEDIAEIASWDDVHEKLDLARHIWGTSGMYVVSAVLEAWLNNLKEYADSCAHNLAQHSCGHSTFNLIEETEHPYPSMQSLLEERLGLCPFENEDGLFYKAYDGRGDEYGEWIFCPKIIESVNFSQGKPIRLEDGSYKKDEYGNIVYSEFTKYTHKEEVIEVTKYATDPDAIVGFDVPLNDYYQFYREIANQ